MQKEHSPNHSSRYFIDQELAFRNFFESAPMMMGIAEIEDNDIRHVSDNEAACRFFGKHPEQMQGRLASELGIDQETIELWLKHYQRSEQTKRPVTFEYQLPEPAVKKYLCVTVSFMGKTAIGHSRFSYIAQDISETRLAQLELEKRIKERTTELEIERTKLHSLLNASPVGIAFMDKNLKYEIINPVLAKSNGKSPDEHLNKTIHEVIPEYAGQLEPVLRSVIESGKKISNWEYESFTEINHERKHAFIANYFPVEMENTIIGVGAVVIDVTDKVKAWRELEESKKILEKTINGLKSERDLRDYFVASLSHDMRTPLTAAKMSAQILNKHPGDREFVHRSATRIIDNMNRADSMIRDLLDANSIKAGEKLPLEIGHCKLNELVTEILDEFNAVHGERFIYQSKSMIEGRWSCSGLRRILENLCNNAIKYGAPQSPITVTLEKNNSWVSLMVHNEGNPIPAADQQKLFEPFRRSQSAQDSLQKGWGLGLTLVKGLAEAHGGVVKVESSKETGTTFIVRIPG